MMLVYSGVFLEQTPESEKGKERDHTMGWRMEGIVSKLCFEFHVSKECYTVQISINVNIIIPGLINPYSAEFLKIY